MKLHSLAGAVALLSISSLQAVEPTEGEMTQARDWAKAQFQSEASGGDQKAALPNGGEPPFSFTYGGHKSSELLKTWKQERTSKKTDGNGTERTVTYTDPATGLTVRCVGLEFADFPAVEWVVYFKNTGAADTPIIEDIQAMNCGLPARRRQTARIHYANGSDCRADDFAPQSAPLGPDKDSPQGQGIGERNPLRLESKGGRSSCGTLPFFNVDLGSNGAIGAVGWTGDWAASFYKTDSEVRMRAGMKKTHLKLLPGEEIRTPRMMLLFWEGERLRSQNLLRRFILAHHTPMVNGKAARIPVSFTTWGGNFAEKHIEHAKWWKENGIPLDFMWVDAGWFGDDEAKPGANVFNSRWANYVGDWHANPKYFPNGLQPVGKAVKDMGMGFLLWFEPERVFKGTSWTREHANFLLGPVGDNYLLDLGNPAARRMLTDHLIEVIKEGNITCYRQDFNMEPKPFWDAADAPDRVGMAEIRHITGLYEMWDEMLAKCPGLLIDNCASGGRRIDLETISRSIPLWPSDVSCWPTASGAAIQGQSYGLRTWVPLSAGCCSREDTYMFRSAMGPGLDLIMEAFEKDSAKHFNVEWLKKMFGEMNLVRDDFLGDFYPLLSFTLAEDSWAAWQFDRPDTGRGTTLAFRRPNSPFPSMTACLHGLDPAARYEVRDVDAGEPFTRSGKELMEKGFLIEIPSQPGSKLFVYKKL